MANNLIQIKRSNTSSSPSPSANLVAGELAFSYSSNSLFIGAQTGASATSYKIGGAKFNYLDQAGNPGVQTANAAVILDANSFTTNTFTQGLVITTSTGSITAPVITAINAVSNSTVLGAASNSELTTTWGIKTYVDLRTGANANPQGSNGSFQYNDSSTLAGTTNMFYDNTTGQISIGNSTINVQIGYTGSINSLAHFHGNQNSYVQVVMNNVNNGTRSSSDFVAQNDAGSETENYVDLGINSSTYNDPAYSAMGAGDAYLYTANNDMVIGTADTGTQIRFVTGGLTTSEIRATIDGGGNVGIGNTAPNARLQVTGTANISGLTTISANLVLGAGLSANGSTGSAGHVLKSGGTGNVYWEAAAAGVAGADTQVQYNDGGSTLAGAAGLTFNKTTNNVSMANNLAVTNTVSIGNSTVNTIANSSLIKVANATASANLSTSNLAIGSSLVNTSTIAVGSNAVHNLTSFTIVGNTTTAPTTTVTGTGLTSGNTSITGAPQVIVANTTATTTVNAGTISVGANVVVDTAKASFGTGATTNAPQVIVANTTGTTTVNANIITVGSNAVHNLTAFAILGNTTTAPTTTLTGSALNIGNTSITGAPQVIVANTTGNVIVNTTSIAISNASATPVLANTLGVFTTGTANAATLSVGTAFIANTTKVTFTGANVDATSALIRAQDLTLTGNLTVQGTLTTVDTTNITIKDSLIKLANGNSTTDTLDIGFYGVYGNSTSTYFSGLYRDRAGSTMTSPLFKLFASNTEPSTIVDNTAAGYVLATLNAYLTTGAFVANATAVNITANSTVSVALTANTLSLTTALPATSGGTGQNTYAAGDLLVGNTGNSLTKLALNTTAGRVLQSNGTALVYDTLDGGTF